MQFCKYHGAGNDFILIDNREAFFEATKVSLLCHRRFGIGADGVILLERSLKADFRMRIYNADGSEASMCGNGVRCLAAFAKRIGALSKDSLLLETLHRLHKVTFHQDLIEVEMGEPKEHLLEEIETSKGPLKIALYNTGVPHAVLFVEDVEAVNLATIGPEIRYHKSFAPHGVNVNVVSRKGDLLAIRTYERGVEDETLACGTGCTAAALAAFRHFGMASPITLETASREALIISFDSDLQDVKMSGHATFVFEGNFRI